MSTKGMLLASFAITVVFLATAMFTKAMGLSFGRQGNTLFLMCYALFFPLLLVVPAKGRCCGTRL